LLAYGQITMSIRIRWRNVYFEKPQLVTLLIALVLFIVPNQDCKNRIL